MSDAFGKNEEKKVYIFTTEAQSFFMHRTVLCVSVPLW
jgi:hypothetical protein